MPTVFISHSSRDVETARALKLRLERVGVTGFLAPDDMRGSDDWPRQLGEAVEGCAVLVLLFSSSANESQHVAREVSIAVDHEKPILALRLDRTRPTASLGYLLQLQQWIDVFPGSLEVHLEKVLGELRSMLTTAATPPATPAGGRDAPGLCTNCGTQNPGAARFCSSCSALLPGAFLGALGRRVVTVLAGELAGPSGAGVDPEASHRILTELLAETRRIVVRHGGIVQSVDGRVVTAVFGLPTLHEDDALRAARAAVELQQAAGARVGIATGEVVSGDPATAGSSITGSVLEAAARLRDAATPGRVLMDAATQDLVRDAAEAVAEPGPAAAFQLVSLDPTAAAHARRLDAPMVGRDRELRGLRQAFDDAVTDRSCHLFTVLGAAGVGKSRLVAEFLAGVASEARTLEGRCLPYGEGITYWPIRMVVHAAADIDDGDNAAAARGKLSALLAGHRDAPEIERTVARAVGLSDEPVTPEELTWGVQRFLEVLAEDQPVVLVLDDVQWAEPTFLDLVEHITDWVRDASILVVCPARPELLEARPGWGGGKLNARSVLLSPLPTEDAQQLLEGLGGAGLPRALQEQIAASAEGNPLFIEEMLNMLRADGVLAADGSTTDRVDLAQVRVPPTIRALLSARIDQLVSEERSVAERASVIGRGFEQGAVAELSPEAERPELRRQLLGLVRKDLVRPDRTVAASDAYEFRHLLIRDAAYDALPKSERAALHERFGRWLISASGDRIGEYEEVVAFHLDRAHGARTDLGEDSAETAALAAEAGDWYSRAAGRASATLDSQTARPLWERAVALLDREDPARLAATYELAQALSELGDLEGARARYAETLEQASDRDPALAVMARIGLLLAKRASNAAWVEEMKTLIEEGLPTLEESGDQRQLSHAYFVLSESLGGAHPDALPAARAAVLHGRRSGDPQARRVAAIGLVQTVVRLPTDEARALIAEYVDQADIVGAARVFYLIDTAHLDAKDGRLSASRAQLAEAIELADRFGQPELMVGAREAAARKARWDGDFAGAIDHFRRALELSYTAGLTYWSPKLEACLALSLFDVHDEEACAELLARLAEHRGEDELADLLAELPRARLLGRRGQVEEGLAALETAIEQLPPMAVLLRTEGRVEAIRMLREAGRADDARAVAARASVDIDTAPAPLYTAMIESALSWPEGTPG